MPKNGHPLAVRLGELAGFISERAEAQGVSRGEVVRAALEEQRRRSPNGILNRISEGEVVLPAEIEAAILSLPSDERDAFHERIGHVRAAVERWRRQAGVSA
jgi:hypothetical protein